MSALGHKRTFAVQNVRFTPESGRTLGQRRQVTGSYLIEYGFSVVADASLADDPTGDQIDALLCAIQAAWSWTQRENKFGAPGRLDALEGWIADPNCH